MLTVPSAPEVAAVLAGADRADGTTGGETIDAGAAFAATTGTDAGFGCSATSVSRRGGTGSGTAVWVGEAGKVGAGETAGFGVTGGFGGCDEMGGGKVGAGETAGA